uniref:Uncharacterized protein n=1 Tax=Acrobeloides nanus TaxID=290746 RepID=A0A914C9D6_9BILA
MKLGERILLNDIANGLEGVAIPVVNDLDDDGPPNIVYLQKRRALPIPDDNGENLVEYLKKE